MPAPHLSSPLHTDTPTSHIETMTNNTLRNSKLALLVCLLFIIILYWWTPWSADLLVIFQAPSNSTSRNSRNSRCLNDEYLLTKKIIECERSRTLSSVKPHRLEPRQVSLTFYGVEGQMGVSWVTYDGPQHEYYVVFCSSSDEHCSSLSPVSYPNPPPAPLSRVSSSCHLFLPFYDCRFLVLHSANLTGLRPGSRYRYRIYGGRSRWRDRQSRFYEPTGADDVVISPSPLFEFLYPANYLTDSSALSPSSSSAPSSLSPQRFLIFADIADNDGGGIVDSLIKEVEDHPPVDMMLAVGDYGYDLMTTRDGLQLADFFKEQMQPIASKIPFMTCPGNHERFPDPGGPFYQYLWRFRTPGNWPDEREKNLSYSINVGKAHLVFINSEALYGNTGYTANDLASHVRWLDSDLRQAASSRKIRPWIIVLGHVPTYCPAVDPPSSRWFCKVLKSPLEHPVGLAIEHLLHDYHVDVAFWGDFHMYERSFPMYRDRRVYKDDDARVDEKDDLNTFYDPGAPIHVVNGVGGNHEGTDILMMAGGPNTDPGFSMPSWSAFRSRDMGFGRLTLFNETHLHYSQVSVFPCPLIDAASPDDPCGHLQWAKLGKTAKKQRKVIDHFSIVKNTN